MHIILVVVCRCFSPRAELPPAPQFRGALWSQCINKVNREEAGLNVRLPNQIPGRRVNTHNNKFFLGMQFASVNQLTLLESNKTAYTENDFSTDSMGYTVGCSSIPYYYTCSEKLTQIQ